MKYEEIELGIVYVHKVSGQYACVIQKVPGGLINQDTVAVRMQEQKGQGAETYVLYEFVPDELEPVDVHLRRNLKEMELKQNLLSDAKKRQDRKEFDELATPSVVN